jgi:hypothetical protein
VSTSLILVAAGVKVPIYTLGNAGRAYGAIGTATIYISKGDNGMKWEEFHSAWLDAKATQERVDSIAATMANMLVGKLRKCSKFTLAELKRELRDFNIRTEQWKP